MRIAIYETGSGFGGSAVSLYRIVKNLDRARFAPLVIVHGLGPKIHEIKAMGVEVRELDVLRPGKMLEKVLEKRENSLIGKIMANCAFYLVFIINNVVNGLKLCKMIRQNGIKLLHLNNGIHEGFAGLLAAWLTGIPCIAHVRGTEPLTRLEKATGKKLSRMITLNSRVFSEYKEEFGAEKVDFIFNGVDLESFTGVKALDFYEEFGIERQGPAIGTIARLVQGKGIDVFLRAAVEVLNETDGTVFFVVGDDPFEGQYERELKGLCRELGIEQRVIFTGWRSDVSRVLAALDVVVQVSTFPEGMSLTPIEAMALKKPVITSDVPGYTDTVVDGECGFVVPAGDHHALAGRILTLVNDKDLAHQMGEAGRERVEAFFDARVTVERVQEVYEDCLKGIG